MNTRATRIPAKFNETTAALKEAVEGKDVWLYLSFPTSVNRNYRAVGGRVILSAPYRLWKKIAAQELQAQRAPRIAGPVSISIILRAPDKRKRDADNALKSVLDCLKSYGVIEDDNNQIVRELSVKWDTGAGHPCVVDIVPIKG